ncbi:MAG: fluoride efflux transporter CrcB [Solibacillus sp.]
MNSLYVGIGGAIGAVLRVMISTTIPFNGTFPFATLCVNLLGCFLLGLFLTSTTIIRNVHLKLALTTGVLGAFTTFSTFSYETLQLLQQGAAFYALLYVGGSLFGGLTFSAIGIFMARRFGL